MKKDFYNIEQLIKEKNISKRELSKFKDIVQNYQPENIMLTSLLTQYMFRNVDNETLKMFDKTIDALFESLDYPTEEWAINDTKKLNGYHLVKESIIEYCTSDAKDISTIIDNVAFLKRISVDEVRNSMQLYMSSYGDISKVMNAFMQYSDDYKSNVKKSNMPEVYIPIYSKAVVSKIKEMKSNKHK